MSGTAKTMLWWTLSASTGGTMTSAGRAFGGSAKVFGNFCPTVDGKGYGVILQNGQASTHCICALRDVTDKVMDLAGEKLVGFVQGICEGINFAGRVVEVETCPRRRSDIKPTHQRLGTMVSSADANAVSVQKGR